MQGTTIEGERQTPDIFFVLPTGKTGNVGGPHLRDYSYEIFDPVVKPWFEGDATLEVPRGAIQTSSSKVDFDEAMKPEPPPPAAPPVEAAAQAQPAPALEPMPRVAAPPLSIPSQARSVPAPSSPPPASLPTANRPYEPPPASLPTTNRPYEPPPASLPTANRPYEPPPVYVDRPAPARVYAPQPSAPAEPPPRSRGVPLFGEPSAGPSYDSREVPILVPPQ
jgi:hypothetical protein